MIKVNTHEAKTKLSQLIVRVEKTRESIVICRNGVPVATLNPFRKPSKDPMKQNSKLKKVVFKEDPSLPVDLEGWPEELR